VNSKKRLTAEEALKHPWVKGMAASGEHMEKTQNNIKSFNARRKMKVKRQEGSNTKQLL
jgi:calcium/calmodulin-dependent protein kinase-4